jgi:hypothetical protein
MTTDELRKLADTIAAGYEIDSEPLWRWEDAVKEAYETLVQSGENEAHLPDGRTMRFSDDFVTVHRVSVFIVDGDNEMEYIVDVA